MRRKRVKGATALIAALSLMAAIAAFALGRQVISSRKPDTRATSVPMGTSLTATLLAGTKAGDRGEALWMALLYHDDRAGKGGIVYVPAHAAVEVPGHGLEALGDTLASGGPRLMLLSAESLLDVPIDYYAVLSVPEVRSLVKSIGPLTVDVPAEVRRRAGTHHARVLVPEGLQELSPRSLLDLLFVAGLDSDDTELGERHLAFWDAVFDRSAEDPAALAEAFESSLLERANEGAAAKISLLGSLAALPPEDRTLTSLPVEQQLTVGGAALYQTDAAMVEAFMKETVGAPAVRQDQIPIQVLNGNGKPGIGEKVANELAGAGFEVVLTGNAQDFPNYKKTLVITYDDSAEGQSLARLVRRLLGVGKVQISAQRQGIVDLTIVVGKDFLRKR